MPPYISIVDDDDDDDADVSMGRWEAMARTSPLTLRAVWNPE